MDTEIRSAINKFIASGNRNVLTRLETIRLLCLLTDNRVLIRVHGIDRLIDNWGPDGAAGRPQGANADYLNATVLSIEELNEHLKDYGLPPIDQWEVDPDEQKYYSTAVIEDVNGVVDEDGDYIVDYTITLNLEFSIPMLPEDFGREICP